MLIAITISDFRNLFIQDGGSKIAHSKLGNIELNQTEIAIWVLPGSLIANSILDFENWPFQDGGFNMSH